MSNNYLTSVTGCSMPVRTKYDQALQNKFNTTNYVENYASPGVTGCAVPVRTKYDQDLQNKFSGCGGVPTTYKRKTQRRRKGIREGYRTKAFDDPDNIRSYGINYAPIS